MTSARLPAKGAAIRAILVEVGYPAPPLRRALPLLACCAGLIAALPAAAQAVPVERGAMPRVRAGTLPELAPHGRVRVIARLSLEPLAQRFGRGLAASGSRRTLDLSSTASRAYLRRIEDAQTAEAVALRRAIPEAHIGRRFQVVLDALTVSLPAAELPKLVRLVSVASVYPSVAYTIALARSPSIIGADVLRAQQ